MEEPSLEVKAGLGDDISLAKVHPVTRSTPYQDSELRNNYGSHLTDRSVLNVLGKVNAPQPIIIPGIFGPDNGGVIQAR